MLNGLQKVMAAEAALMQSVNAALPTAAASQGGLAPLMADLVQAQQITDLPAVLQAAIVEVLALRSPLDAKITGADIKAALAKSGLLSEAKAAVGLQATNTAAQIPPAATDIKTVQSRPRAPPPSPTILRSQLTALARPTTIHRRRCHPHPRR
jgi:predicted naringenin-chalcone synthase